MAGDAVERYKAAERRLEEAVKAGDVHRKALQTAQEALTAVGRRGIGIGRTAAPSASKIQEATKAVQQASDRVREAAKEQSKLEGELLAAKAQAAQEQPALFMPEKLEVPPAWDPHAEAAWGAPAALPPPSTIALMFPGQGSQYVNMLSTVKDDPEVKAMIADAEAVLGWDPLDVCLNGPEAKLEETSVCQPCMFLGGMAALVQLKKQKPEAVENPGAVAGLSLGEYTALCAAGVFTFKEGMELVMIRGKAMAEAAQSRPQAMLSIFGLDQELLEKLCAEQAKGGEVCQIANLLFPRGFSCAGTANAITRLKDTTMEAGAMQAKLLKTSGGFHTELMQPAQLQLQEALDRLLPSMKPPTCDIYMNVTGKKIRAGTPPSEIVPLLARQLCSPVLWEASVHGMIESGMTEFYECGPMKQMKAMMKRIDMNMWSSTTNIEV